MFTTILVIAVVAYAIQTAFLCAGLVRASRARRREGYEPRVSVIVAARNEEAHIGECVASLLALEYPSDKLELVVVNDGSTDRTGEIVESYRDPRLRCIPAGTARGNLRGKANAVAKGVDKTTGEIIMLTDADCIVPAGWIRETVKYFEETTGVVGGYTLLRSRSLFEAVQTIDWIYLFNLASSMAGWGIPLTAIGNNFAVRRSAYYQVGGFSHIPFSVTEDYALARAVYEKTHYALKFPVDPGMLVESSPCRDIAQLFRQKQRWGVGGLDMVARGKIITAVGWFAKLSLFAAAFSGKLALVLVLVVAGAELAFVGMPLKKFGRLSKLLYFPVFELYFTLYVLLIPFVAYFSKKVVWKERELRE